MKRSILVTGGAGYIGSHMVKRLLGEGHAVAVFDNLSTGHADAVAGAQLIHGDLRSAADIGGAFASRSFDCVMHFAASCYVGESVQDPAKYYVNNVIGSLNLLEAMRAAGVLRLVFSSTCSTYGNPLAPIIDESHPQQPVNPYGASKLAVERIARDYAKPYGLRTVALRYFNAAGCDPEGVLGERHEPETHLIPLVLGEALRLRAGGATESTGLRVFGDDFDTPDGTCIRDYIHVSDLCEAHLLAMHRLSLDRVTGFEAFNLGTGQGSSVKEVVDACRRVTGHAIGYQIAARRPGDPSRLVAAADHARKSLGWTPRFLELESTVATAWKWFASQPRKSSAAAPPRS